MPTQEHTSTAKGSSIVIKGELTAAEDMAFHGTVEGTISLPGHTLTIGPDAHVAASVVAKDVIVHGFVIGDVTANSRLDIKATARMTGELSSPNVLMADGAEFSGQVNMPAASKRASAKEQSPLAKAV
jgi:cytoskeletal protein CcmA (bactofilin family)